MYSTCRLDWRTSRPLAAALVILGGLAAISILASALPALTACLAAGAAFGWSLHSARRELARAGGTLTLDGQGRGRWQCVGDVVALQEVSVVFRGPLVVVTGRTAQRRTRRWLFWPGMLVASDRRRLRLLAGPARGGDAAVPSVAA
ncbi:protein YgfX [Arenimonas composti]|uniref:Toxin CptA n=1 Tax=Arenimonas composti TR7-09 = DSM 18010 TaxID=1121013 RepID=A0A091B5Z2_9GAMM|nr:protein YgfX [Arenimonas composti]KFN46284.1 hypothetical protein P873_01875 [Arenimonas composti TR7-09 = DSM 18010]